jgi:hypothetical protein
VRGSSRKQAWRRRIIALATAYVMALSSLLASFGTARAAAAGAFDPAGAICHHSSAAGQADPRSDHRNGNTCIDCCCVGCLMPMAALPPPPAMAAPAPAAVAHRLAPRAIVPPPGAPTAKSHRSRAPPA